MNFSHYLKTHTGIPHKRHPYYLQYASAFRSFIQDGKKQGDPSNFTDEFLQTLNTSVTDWQLQQAREAVNTYLYFCRVVKHSINAPDKLSPPADWKEARSKLENILMIKHRSLQTAKAYLYWLDQIALYSRKASPHDLEDEDFINFISFLAVERQVASSTQNQAFNALLFLYRHILGRDPSRVRSAVRASRPAHLPEVLSRDEIRAVLSHLGPRNRLICGLIYGGGLRLSECLNLRIKDVDLNDLILFIRQGKGAKDRRTLLSHVLEPELREHMVRTRDLFEEDRSNGSPGVSLPGAFDRKDPQAEYSWSWYWLFPSSRISIDPRTHKPGRYHMYPTTIQRAFKQALQKSSVTKRASVHTLRHSFATHMIEDGYDVRTVQELLGHASVNTTMVYTHIAERNKLGARSPLTSVWS